MQLSLLRRDGYIAAPRGSRYLDESDTAFHRAVVLHLGELAVDLPLHIVVGPPLGAYFRAVKRAVRKAYPPLCCNCVHETKAVRRRNAGPRRGDPYHLTRSRRPKGTRDNTQKGYLNWHAYVDAPSRFSHKNSNATREPPKRKRHEKQTQDTSTTPASTQRNLEQDVGRNVA